MLDRVLALSAGLIAALISLPVSAETTNNAFGLPIAPNGGNKSIHQWGGVDDLFAVNPDGEEATARVQRKASSPLARDRQQDAQASDSGDPDSDHFDEILPI